MKIRNRHLIRFAARLAVWSARLLFFTLRKNYVDTVRGCYSPAPEDHFIYIAWHDSLLMPIFSARAYEVSALISRHEDGSYLADAMQMLGMLPIRGSSSRGGAQAVRQLMEKSQSRHIYITPDGPRGPRRKLKHGTVYLASQTGMRIQCIGCYACNPWIVQGSWTDLVIPKPFSRIVMRAAPPITVPPGLSREQLEPYVQQVQETLDRINAITRRIALGEEIDVQAEFLAKPKAA